MVGEVGSGVNGNRLKLHKLLSDPCVTMIVVEHRERFGAHEHRIGGKPCLAGSGRSVVVVDNTERVDDLVRDMTEVLTFLCARLYGRSAAKNRAARALAAAAQSPEDRDKEQVGSLS